MTLTLAYGSHPDQVADLTLPAGADRAPLVFFLHGGFWRAAHDRVHVRPVVAALADLGYAVANVEYRRTGFPGTLDDVALAADRLPGLIEAAAPGAADLDRIVYSGHSAGGHLAIWAALRSLLPAGAPGHRPVPPRTAGVVALAPVLDLGEAYQLGGGNGAVREFLGGSPDEVPDRYAIADPAALPAPGVPVRIVHGERDESVPVAMSHQYAARTGATLITPDATHFDLIDVTGPAWSAVTGAFAGLLMKEPSRPQHAHDRR